MEYTSTTITKELNINLHLFRIITTFLKGQLKYKCVKALKYYDEASFNLIKTTYENKSYFKKEKKEKKIKKDVDANLYKPLNSIDANYRKLMQIIKWHNIKPIVIPGQFKVKFVTIDEYNTIINSINKKEKILEPIIDDIIYNDNDEEEYLGNFFDKYKVYKSKNENDLYILETKQDVDTQPVIEELPIQEIIIKIKQTIKQNGNI